MVIRLPPIDTRKKTCPTGQHLENGVCVPDVKPEKEKLAPKPKPPITDKGRKVAFVEKEGKQFVLPAREEPELRSIQEEERKQAALRLETEALAQQVGQVPPPGAPIADVLDYEQAVKSAIAGLGPAVVTGAGAGLAAGLATAGPTAGLSVPVGVAIGTTAGLISGFIAGFKSNLKIQRKDMLTGEATNIRKIESNMLKHIMNVDKGGDPYEWLEMFNDQMSIADENNARLTLETTDDLSLWLGEDGKTQMEKYEIFYSDGGARDLLILQMQEAIRSPNPNRVYPQDLDNSTPE